MQQKGNPQLVPVKATLGEGMAHSIAKVMGVIIMFYQSLNQWLLHMVGCQNVGSWIGS